jgi:hypothetical protein
MEEPAPPVPQKAQEAQRLDDHWYKIGHQKWVSTVLLNHKYEITIDSCCENDTLVFIQKNSKEGEIKCLSEMIDKQKEYIIQNPSDTE